jgi:hypothetical protein
VTRIVGQPWRPKEGVKEDQGVQNAQRRAPREGYNAQPKGARALYPAMPEGQEEKFRLRTPERRYRAARRVGRIQQQRRLLLEGSPTASLRGPQSIGVGEPQSVTAQVRRTLVISRHTGEPR